MASAITVSGVKAVGASPKALKCEHKYGCEFWVPLACITEESEVHSLGDEGVLAVTKRFADSMGWQDVAVDKQ